MKDRANHIIEIRLYQTTEYFLEVLKHHGEIIPNDNPHYVFAVHSPPKFDNNNVILKYLEKWEFN